MLRGFLYSEGKQEASMDSVKQIIFLAHDRNRIVMLRITRVHKIHEEARLVDIVPRLDGPMPMFQVSRAELEELWFTCCGVVAKLFRVIAELKVKNAFWVNSKALY